MGDGCSHSTRCYLTRLQRLFKYSRTMSLVQLLRSHIFGHLIICYVFLVSGIIINVLQLCTLPLWPLNKQLARKVNCRLAYCISSQMVAVLEWWSGTECILYTDPKTYPLYGKENAIVVLNHSFEIDFLCGWTFCERLGVLGSSKVLAKKELAYVPVIGWMWYFLEIVFCKRKWEEDRKTVAQSLQNLRDYPENYWFLLYCEGTRFTPKKHEISMQVAETKGLPKLKYHLLPRTKGFWVTVQNLRGTVKAVYDSTLNFRNNETPTLLGILSGRKYHADLYVSCFGLLPGESHLTSFQKMNLSVLIGSTNSTRKRIIFKRATCRRGSTPVL
ncbi:1-acyl-sn-glycerol-3-phosphate acyltransferase delta isoform X4 [Corythoichthys intestinalis]|uniref:1-acyl-sn-glycerol-3-phosphate acyltransferase delta isoform X4 n=1 Tax=Corythoichthys intestinalis TaxID=161448 RepID=UPI0025A66AE9|nr:1-acyl-sn-glycerol-3-phosphate acyltransferase delta isoform X4 [Corythoichthys intestinalis]